MKNLKTPKTIDQAVLNILMLPDIEVLKNNNPIDFHHSAGRQIRNEWKLWDKESNLHKEFNAIGIFHADDMSEIIFDTAHRIINGKTVDLVGQVKYYQSYWFKAGFDTKGNKLDD